MSKIDEYKAAKKDAEDARDFADRVAADQPHDSCHYYDKLGMCLEIGETWAGYYGNSSTHSWNQSMKAEIKKQIKMELREIIERTACRLERVADAKRIAASDEAREVLGETSP